MEVFRQSDGLRLYEGGKFYNKLQVRSHHRKISENLGPEALCRRFH